MTGVIVTAQGFEVNAATLAAAFGMDIAQLREKMGAVALPLNRVILNLCGAEEAFGP